MATRIDQAAGFLGELLQETRAGRLVPATFQRPYAWEEDDVLRFWHSVLRGWPTGTYLFWDPLGAVDPGRFAKARIGPIPARPDDRMLVVLDGQNRLASYAWSLHLPGSPVPDDSTLSPSERRTWTAGRHLVADAARERILFVDAAEMEARGNEVMPVAFLGNNPELNRWARDSHRTARPVEDRHFAWISDVADRAVRDARISRSTIRTADPEEALEAFRHVARAGVPMSDEDFEAAMSFAFETPAPSP